MSPPPSRRPSRTRCRPAPNRTRTRTPAGPRHPAPRARHSRSTGRDAAHPCRPAPSRRATPWPARPPARSAAWPAAPWPAARSPESTQAARAAPRRHPGPRPPHRSPARSRCSRLHFYQTPLTTGGVRVTTGSGSHIAATISGISSNRPQVPVVGQFPARVGAPAQPKRRHGRIDFSTLCPRSTSLRLRKRETPVSPCPAQSPAAR